MHNIISMILLTMLLISYFIIKKVRPNDSFKPTMILLLVYWIVSYYITFFIK